MENVNISSFEPLIQPIILKNMLPITQKVSYLVNQTRTEISDIIHKRSNKKLFIVGPCSIHDIDQAFEYAKELKKIADQVKSKILIVMRVYFEKPRTTVGWKGLINDPDLDNSFKVNKGLELARSLLLKINGIGLPCGYEVLDTITPQYISDLVSWGAIGARTTESQVHRQIVSGLSMPVGFKNSTSGCISVAAEAILSAHYPHCFMGITEQGIPAICNTTGNQNCHIILRGGKNGSNYSIEDINNTKTIMNNTHVQPSIMVDCSHGNSNKDYRNQSTVLKKTINNMTISDSIIGVMIESNINCGKQKLVNKKNLKYGISITDSCIDLNETSILLIYSFQTLSKRKADVLDNK